MADTLPRRLLWFVTLWAAGVFTVVILGYVIKLMLGA